MRQLSPAEWALHDALTIRALHGLRLASGRVVCRRCGPAYRWPCAKFDRAHEVVCQLRRAVCYPAPSSG